MEKTIKIAFVNFWEDINYDECITLNILKKHYNVVFDYENPDFIFASVFGNITNVLKYNCPRILVLGEPVSPDFTIFDYAIGSDMLSILDRNNHNRFFRFIYPFFLWHNKILKDVNKPVSYDEARKILKNKTRFCNFIYSHDTKDKNREKVLTALNNYKKVDSLGKYLNNMDNIPPVDFNPHKIELMENYKFSIAYESMSFPGFITEKIVHAFGAHSIPIYFGDPFINDIFNSESFINVKDYESLDKVIDKIIEIDTNDELYFKMISAKKFTNDDFYNSVMNEYENFLLYIFNQTPLEAIRRQLFYTAERWEKDLKTYFSLDKNKKDCFCVRLKRKVKRLVLKIFKK